MSVEPLLRVENLVKVFPGGVRAVDGVSFEMSPGEVVALVGPNGAGKTTTFRIIATLLKPSSGRVLIEDVDVVKDPLEARKRLVFVPEEVGGYRQLTGLEYIEFAVRVHLGARGASEDEIRRAVREAVELTGLDRSTLRRKMGEYSKGMKRRVQVAWALAVKPRLVILDEPTGGLDVEASYKLRMLIREYARREGVAVLLSSHNMLEVESVADRVYLMRSGRIVASGRPSEIIERVGARNLEEAYMKLVGVM
ncbi:ABC transporter-related protein [Pyrolobus fumarii 1A]|uniref:ABC transporter-related protein n=1 Tax=Pyrolobus fumarii (strain DSM 11204 / 1A) TaxID=694429 RepID=G0EHH9_PYRF1|nr:ABC transporter ATP-binding protein [Pyrolobus fumarii]AEM38554.1 ABC transporter-related protein [Pyrolobus fumarii 1A]